MKGAWEWTKKHAKVVLSAVVAVLLAVLGAGWLWRRRDRELGRVKDQLAVAEAQRKIARLRGVRQEIAARIGEKDEAVRQLDEQLAANRRAIIEAHENGQGLSDDEIDAALERLGY